ncbi:MAG: FtsX-like permease family protein [Thermoleophilia bacterium]|nr:FtsX-like permease family protein [Thermoleophilia bacterium]
MEKLFGIPINNMMIGLLVALGIGAGIIIIAALRNPVLFKMGVRNITRRPAQTSLIVLGLMLTTLLFSAALSTGDTMNFSIRKSAMDQLGPVDEIVRAKSVSDQESHMGNQTGRAQTNGQFFGPAEVDRIRGALAADGLTDGIAPVVADTYPALSPASRQNLPELQVLGVESDYAAQTEPLETASGQVLTIESLSENDAFMSTKAADKLDVKEGGQVQVFSASGPRLLNVAGVYDSGGKSGSIAPSMVVPIRVARDLAAKPDSYNMVLISNQGGVFEGVDRTDAVTAALEPAIADTNLEIQPLKQKALAEAEQAASSFTSIFLLFGEFSMIAGVLLIFLIFVMLAAERKTELGVMRAMGSKRRDILKVFAFEGVVYAALAAAVGAVLGVVVGWGMVQILASAFGSFEEFSFSFSFNVKSLVIAYSMGMIATYIIVIISAWRTGHLNIVRAIRDIPEPEKGGRRLRWLLTSIGMLIFGVLLTMVGLSSKQSGWFMLGTSFLIVGIPFVLRYFRLPDRIVFTIAGLGLLAWWLPPESVWNTIFPFWPEDMNAGMEMFILSGIAVVAGSIWAVMYNSDILLAAVVGVFGRLKGLPPILKISVNYPMRTRFRTGMALAMFSLIIFTMTFMSAMMNSFSALYDDIPRVSGGFEVQGITGYSNPVTDVNGTLATKGDGIGPDDFTAIGSLATAGAELRQVGAENQEWSQFAIQGADAGYLDNINYTFKMKDKSFKTDAEVWQAIKNQPGLAVVHSSLLPTHSNFNQGGPAITFQMSGVYQEDEELPDNLFIEVKDPVTGELSRLKVIGVIEPLAFYATMGIFTSQDTISQMSSRPVPPTSFWFRTAPGVNAVDASRGLQRTFYESGMNTIVIEDNIRSSMRAMSMINNLLTGFMGLGLVVGIAALGVIAARAVVERRQQIGMLRAIGFRRGMVQKAFLLESSFVALLGITIGSVLGLTLCYSVMTFIAKDMAGLTYQIPWFNVVFIGVLAYAASLLTTYLPAHQASKVYPAEALRYE